MKQLLMVPEVPLSLLIWQIYVSVMKCLQSSSECVIKTGLLALSFTTPTLTFSFWTFLLHIKLSSKLNSHIGSA